MDNSKICVVGLGGVGGYIGCMLAKHFSNVYFLARGKRLESIKNNGLKLYSNLHGELNVHPKLASDSADEIGIMDYIFICVKNFSLEQVCKQIKPMINENTVIIPLMNGVGVSEKVRKFINDGQVIDSLIYVVSGAEKDFSIHHASSYCKVHIGYGLKNDNEVENVLIRIQKILQEAEIICKIEKEIEAAIWRKYILNCAYNVITAYYNATTAEIIKNDEAVQQTKILLKEACAVARKLKINISDDVEEEHFYHLMHKQAGESTSSLKRDIEAGRQNELEVFSGKLIELALNCQVEVPMSQFFYGELKKKS